MASTSQQCAPGDVVTFQVLRSYVEEESLSTWPANGVPPFPATINLSWTTSIYAQSASYTFLRADLRLRGRIAMSPSTSAKRRRTSSVTFSPRTKWRREVEVSAYRRKSRRSPTSRNTPSAVGRCTTPVTGTKLSAFAAIGTHHTSRTGPLQASFRRCQAILTMSSCDSP
jgi:hypothetical protein